MFNGVEITPFETAELKDCADAHRNTKPESYTTVNDGSELNCVLQLRYLSSKQNGENDLIIRARVSPPLASSTLRASYLGKNSDLTLISISQ